MIGICAAIHPAKWTVWQDVEANISQRTYSLVAGDAGALPLILPPDEASSEDPGQLLDLLDALLLTGGADLDPALYGAERGPQTQPANAARDGFELALARAALARDMPLLGICRGMQLLNVVCGGSLDQHMEVSEGHLNIAGVFADHEVSLEPGSLAARAVGAERVAVRSHHHQGVGRLGEGLVVSGRAEPDGIVEAIELPDRRFALGVLWHAEEERHSPVIAALADAARARETVA